MKLIQHNYIRATEVYSIDINTDFCAELCRYLDCERVRIDYLPQYITPDYVLMCYNDIKRAENMYYCSGLEKDYGEWVPITLPEIIENYVNRELGNGYEAMHDCEVEDTDVFVEEEITVEHEGIETTHIALISVDGYFDQKGKNFEKV